jgi:hypothetical protein
VSGFFVKLPPLLDLGQIVPPENLFPPALQSAIFIGFKLGFLALNLPCNNKVISQLHLAEGMDGGDAIRLVMGPFMWKV